MAGCCASGSVVPATSISSLAPTSTRSTSVSSRVAAPRAGAGCGSCRVDAGLHPHRSMTFLALVVLALGACALPNPGPDPCVVTGGAPRTDVSRARDACTQARQRFAATIGEAPAGTITLSPSQGLSTFTEGGRWTLTWPMSSRLTSGMSRSNPSDTETRRFLDEQWQEVLPH